MKAIVLLLLFVNLLVANIAKVTAIKGDVKLLRDTQEIPLTLNFLLNEKDTIVTSENGRVQLIFEDQTIISLGKKSTFSIQEYLYDEQKPKDAKATFKVAQGIFKTITGKIGKINPNKFKLKTKSASIGIRGTIFFGRVIPGKPLYVACTEGIVLVITPQGVREVRAGYFIEVKEKQIPAESKPLTKPTQNTLEVESGATDNEKESTQSSNNPSVQKNKNTPPSATTQKKPPPPSSTGPVSNPVTTIANAATNTNTLEKTTKETVNKNSVTNPDGSLTLKGGTTIKPDGSIVLSDGTQVKTPVSLTPDGKVTLANGTIINPDSTITLPDGTTLSTKANVSENGTITLDNGTIIHPNGTITLSNGTTLTIGASVTQDGTITLDNGIKINPNGDITLDNGNSLPNGATLNADGTISLADGSSIAKDGTITLANGTTLPDGASIGTNGTITLANGATISGDGTITLADGTTLPDSASVNSNGQIVLANGTALEDGYSVNDDGTITLADGSNVYQDGTTVPPPTPVNTGGGSNSSNLKTATYTAYGTSTYLATDDSNYIVTNNYYQSNNSGTPSTSSITIEDGVLNGTLTLTAYRLTISTPEEYNVSTDSPHPGIQNPYTVTLEDINLGNYSDTYTGFKKIDEQSDTLISGSKASTYVDTKHEFFIHQLKHKLTTPESDYELNMVFGEQTHTDNLKSDGISFYIEPPETMTLNQSIGSGYTPTANTEDIFSTNGTYINWKSKNMLSYTLKADEIFVAAGNVGNSGQNVIVDTKIYKKDIMFKKGLTEEGSNNLYFFGTESQGLGGTIKLKDEMLGNQVYSTYGAFKIPNYNGGSIPTGNSTYEGFISNKEDSSLTLDIKRASEIKATIQTDGSSPNLTLGGTFASNSSFYITDDTLAAITHAGQYSGKDVSKGWLIAIDSGSLNTNGDDKISWGYWAVEYDDGGPKSSGLQAWVAGDPTATSGANNLDDTLTELKNGGLNILTYTGSVLGNIKDNGTNYNIDKGSSFTIGFDIASATRKVDNINLSLSYNNGTTFSKSIPNAYLENNEINISGNAYGANTISHPDINLSIEGKFYGDSAKYTAGRFSLDDGVNSSPTVEANGVFKAKR